MRLPCDHVTSCSSADQVSKRISDLISIEDYDEWLTMTSMPTTSNVIQDTPSAPHIRIKLRYKHDIILPMHDYVDFRTVSADIELCQPGYLITCYHCSIMN